ncbi:MAG: VPLPA-CTERM-specific exosortase XrtD [Proteobacteria bacterium]|nr:VPLPA-CTERM-specific exosortase XrtD [Pseudomonadota bacterium]
MRKFNILEDSKLMNIKPVSWIKAGIYAFLIVITFYSALNQLVFHDWDREDYSHCLLIPFIVLYLIWDYRQALIGTPSVVDKKGFILLMAGILLFWLGELGGEYYTMYLSLWLVVVGLVWVHFGWNKIKVLWFAFFVMLTMFPFPNIINVRITFALKLIATKLGVLILQAYGMSAYREGNIIDLGFTQLQVVEACSGLRFVMPLMVLSLLLAFWFRAHIWKRTALFLSSIPIAILMNSFRIAGTGVLYSVWGAQVAEGFFHDFSGWLVFMFTIPILLAEMWILRKLPPRLEFGNTKDTGRTRDEGRGTIGESEKEATGKSEAVKQTGTATVSMKAALLQPVFIVALVLLGITLVASRTIEFREKIPIKKPLSQLSLKIGEWNGTKQIMEQQFVEVLNFSDYTIVDYKNNQGKSINFYTAYYESQRKGEATHSPESCLPGSGWQFNEADPINIKLKDGSLIKVNRAFMEKAGDKQLSYYWFAQRGRVLTNLYQVKFYSFWDALTKQRTDGALVRLITPVYSNENPQDADKRLQDFTKEIVPILKNYIPE